MHHAKRGGVIQRSIKDTFSGGDHDRDHSVRHRKCADHAGDNEVGIVERRPVRVRHRVAELAAFVYGAGRLWRDVTRNSVEGDDPKAMHELMAATLETVVGEIRSIQRKASGRNRPIVVLVSPCRSRSR